MRLGEVVWRAGNEARYVLYLLQWSDESEEEDRREETLVDQVSDTQPSTQALSPSTWGMSLGTSVTWGL